MKQPTDFEQTTELDYLDLEKLALELSFFGEPAFLHGALVGVLVVNPFNFDIVEEFFCQISSKDMLSASQKKFLEKLHTQNLAQMQDLDLIFKPLVALEFNSCAQRYNSIAAWLAGFMRGIDKGGVDLSKASKDLKDFLATSLKISEQEHSEQSLPNDEANKEDLKILEDFVKLGVLYAYTDWVMQAPKNTKIAENKS